MLTTQLRRLTTALALAFAGAAGPAQGATTYTVNSIADSPDAGLADSRCLTAYNECTLRAAIQQANATDGPDRIVFAIGGRVTLNDQLPTINTDLDIRGPGADSLTLWQQQDVQQRVLSIGSPAHVHISGLTIAHGWASEGGGIYNGAADLSIADCVISGNLAATGGGIWSLAGALSLVRTCRTSRSPTARSTTTAPSAEVRS
jgi:CSLREA domain-containing protein